MIPSSFTNDLTLALSQTGDMPTSEYSLQRCDRPRSLLEDGLDLLLPPVLHDRVQGAALDDPLCGFTDPFGFVIFDEQLLVFQFEA